MKYKEPFFKECKEWWWGGWFVNTRDNNTYRLTKQHLTNDLKNKYEEEFGEKIITEDEFNEWYIRNLIQK
jgi:hypothetical protein